MKQSRFAPQVMDVLVDSRFPEYYLAVECKSLDARKAGCLYFRQHFSVASGEHQLDREDRFVQASGRSGLLAVELRWGGGRTKEAHMLPWTAVMDAYRSGQAGLTMEGIVSYPALGRQAGQYLISHELISRLHSIRPPDPQEEIEPDGADADW